MEKNGQFLEMRKLYYFRQVANSRSLRHAARQLGITQPALTRHVQSLEHELGLTLVHRHASGNKLTEAGQLLASKAEELLAMSSSLKNNLVDLQRTMHGTVTLAISMGHMPVLLDPFLESFIKQYPDVQLRLMEGLTRHVEEWIEWGQADIGVICLPTGSCQLVQEPLIREDLVLLSTDPARAGQPVDFHELEETKLILPLMRFGTRQLLQNTAAQHKVRLHPAIEADNRQTVRHLVLSTGWSAIDAARLFADEIAAGKIFARPLVPRLTRDIVLATSQSTALSSAARTVASEIRRSVQRQFGKCAQKKAGRPVRISRSRPEQENQPRALPIPSGAH
jgi:LysR family nitrogen assimilation transcriptional regulator